MNRATQLSIRRTDSRDPRAVAANLLFQDPIERFDLAKAAAKLKDPYAIQELGFYFHNRVDLDPQHRYDLGNGLLASRRIMMDAFHLAACEYGADCGPDNIYVVAECVNLAYCDSSLLTETYMRYRYSPADFQTLMAAREIVVEGLRSGQWPPGMWPPPDRIPRHLQKK